MNKAIIEQLNMLKTLEFQVDGKPSKDFPESFSEVVFKRNSANIIDTSEKIVVFEDYIITPFEGFDFHDKFNKGVAPPQKVMFGIVTKETEKMVYLNVRSEDNQLRWSGWCPRKSCKISNK